MTVHVCLCVEWCVLCYYSAYTLHANCLSLTVPNVRGFVLVKILYESVK